MQKFLYDFWKFLGDFSTVKSLAFWNLSTRNIVISLKHKVEFDILLDSQKKQYS